MPCRRRKTERFQGQFFRAHGRPRRKSHAACNGRKCDFQTFSRYEMKRCLRQCDYDTSFVKGIFCKSCYCFSYIIHKSTRNISKHARHCLIKSGCIKNESFFRKTRHFCDGILPNSEKKRRVAEKDPLFWAFCHFLNKP